MTEEYTSKKHITEYQLVKIRNILAYYHPQQASRKLSLTSMLFEGDTDVQDTYRLEYR